MVTNSTKAIQRYLALVIFVSLAGLVADAYAQPFEVVRDREGLVVRLDFFGDAEELKNIRVDGITVDKIDSLKEVRLNNHDITHSELRFLATIKSVTSIAIGELPVEIELSGDELQHLGEMNWLTSLEVSETGLEPEDWRFLNALPALQRLSINAGFKDNSASYLVRLKQLRDIRLAGEFTSATVQSLAAITQLRHVALNSAILDPNSIDFLAALPNLEKLSIWSEKGTRDTNAFFPQVARLKNLRELGISMPSDRETLEPLKDLRLLTSLVVCPSNGIPFSLTEFMPELKTLRLISPQDSATFQKLDGHKALQTIFVDGSTFEDASIDVLNSMPNLQSIEIRGWKSSVVAQRASQELKHIHFIGSERVWIKNSTAPEKP